MGNFVSFLLRLLLLIKISLLPALFASVDRANVACADVLCPHVCCFGWRQVQK